MCVPPRCFPSPADFGIGQARKSAERFVSAFEDVYYLRWVITLPPAAKSANAAASCNRNGLPLPLLLPLPPLLMLGAKPSLLPLHLFPSLPQACACVWR